MLSQRNRPEHVDVDGDGAAQPEARCEPVCEPGSLDERTRAEIAGWVAAHWDEVFGLLYRMGCGRHEAEDLSQEALLRAGQRRASFVGGTNVRAWLMRIATNAFLDSRRRKKVAKIQPLAEAVEISGGSGSPSDGIHKQELGAALESALQSLPETTRLIVLLRMQADLSFKEIAASLEIKEEVARGHVFRARQRLMELLKRWI